MLQNFNPETKRIHITNKITWLNCLLYSKSCDVVEADTASNKRKVKFKEDIAVDIDDKTINLQLEEIQSNNTATTATNINDADDESSKEGIDYDAHNLDEDKGEVVTVAQSGRHVCRPKYGQETGAFTVPERNYYSELEDFDDFDDDEVVPLVPTLIMRLLWLVLG